MLFPNTSFYDGSVGVTQCGIPPGATFSYSVPLTTQPPGTYWWHAHNQGIYVDGLAAPFIIHADTEPYTYDDEYVLANAGRSGLIWSQFYDRPPRLVSRRAPNSLEAVHVRSYTRCPQVLIAHSATSSTQQEQNQFQKAL